MNGNDFHRLRFYQEQLFDTKHKLFSARNVKQVKFFQDRINFLQERIEDIENGRKR